MYTRKDYLDHKCTHAEYYAQFVTSAIKETVRAGIGVQRLLRSADPYLNDIPLATWDGLGQFIGRQTNEKMREHGDSLSMAGKVCIVKEAARQIIAEAKQ